MSPKTGIAPQLLRDEARTLADARIHPCRSRLAQSAAREMGMDNVTVDVYFANRCDELRLVNAAERPDGNPRRSDRRGEVDCDEFRPNYSAITQCAWQIRQACGMMLPRLVGLSEAVIQDRESVVSHAHDVISQ
jgi:hypothetical protein